MQINTDLLVKYLQLLSPECLSIMSLMVCYTAIALHLRFWQVSGLYVYTVLAIIIANLQVLKAAHFAFYSEPVALGTIVYSTSFLASDVITEFFGPKAAKKGVWLSFSCSFIMLSLMMLTIGYAPLNIDNNSEYIHFNAAHNALATIFTPAPAILAASLIAYGTSQFTDIFIFSKIRQFTGQQYLWVRIFFSVMIAAWIDALVFNVLAWKIFNSSPVSWTILFNSYIISNYFLQIIIAILNIPVFYILKKIVKCTQNSTSQ